MSTAHAREVASGQRFEFGKNWARFLAAHTPEHAAQAEASLREMLGVQDLSGKTFVDAGSGSGLFSLAARRLGARVYSFDFDPHSVACTMELKRRYFDGDKNWTIEEGSVLDTRFLSGRGQFDVVYSWGVLHHTGAMWNALENVIPLVKEGGTLFIAIYNDQGTVSRRWTKVKRLYNRLPCRAAFPGHRAGVLPAVVAPHAEEHAARPAAGIVAHLQTAARNVPLVGHRRLGRWLSVRGRQTRGDLPLLP